MTDTEIWQAAADAVLYHKLSGYDQTAAGFYAAVFAKRDAVRKLEQERQKTIEPIRKTVLRRLAQKRSAITT